MKTDNRKKRLKAIKLRFVFFSTKCEHCGNEYKRERMWQLYRYGINKTAYKWHYCRKCMHSAEDVLNEVDTDEFAFGIAGVDDFNTFVKKDSNRMNLANEKAFEQKDDN